MPPYDFPASPTEGQEYTPTVGQQTYVYKAPRWLVKGVPPASGGGGGGGGAGVTDGDKGDIVVSGSGATWLFDSSVVTAAAKTVLDDASVSAMLATLGGLPSASYTAADVLAKLLTVDGAGSLLDADFLDGNSSAFYATATALSGKEPTIASGTTAQYWRGDKSWQTFDKTAVGLGNVDNTSDASKPVSTAQAAADALNVLKAGDTMTGDLTVSKANAALVVNKAASGQDAIIKFQTGGLMRWHLSSNVTAESAGAGSNLFITRYNDAGAAIDNPFQIARSTGNIVLGKGLNVFNTLAITAGGVAGGGLTLSSATNFGVFFGSGAPTLSAAKGSLYLRSDGAGTNTRVYVNTDGTTGWAAMSVIATGTSAPSSPATNDVWIDTT